MTRYSSDRHDARSIDAQLRRCRGYAASRSFRVGAEFSDAAKTGANVEQEGMQRLLAAARMGRGSAFGIVHVDDLARLSRDLGDTWQIVFRDPAAVSVKVIDGTTGLASEGAGARLTSGALALLNDTLCYGSFAPRRTAASNVERSAASRSAGVATLTRRFWRRTRRTPSDLANASSTIDRSSSRHDHHPARAGAHCPLGSYAGCDRVHQRLSIRVVVDDLLLVATCSPATGRSHPLPPAPLTQGASTNEREDSTMCLMVYIAAHGALRKVDWVEAAPAF